MKKVMCFLFVLCVGVALPVVAVDANYYWSGDGANPGGDGTWDNVTAHFGSATNGPFDLAWDNATMGSDRANFTVPAGTVSVIGDGITCRRLNVLGSGYVFYGGKITSDEINNRFVIDKAALNLVIISNDFDLTVTGNANIRIRNQGGLANPLVLAGTYQFMDGSSTKRLDLDGTGASGSRIDFTGSLLNTPGATVRLRCGENGGNRGNNASVYNLSGSSSHAGGTHVINGTVYVSNPNALGAGSVQLVTSTTLAGDTVRMFIEGAIDLPNDVGIFTASAKDNGVVTAVFGKADADASESTIMGTINLNSDSTLLDVHVGHSNAVLTFTSLITDSTGVRGFIKTGAGTLVITGPNVYEGVTHVNGGTLLANSVGGSATGSGTVQVNAGGVLGGAGRIGGAAVIEADGALAPGASVGTIRINQLTLNAGSTVLWEKDMGTDVTDKAIITNLLITGNAAIHVLPLSGAEPDGEVVTNTIFKVVGSMDGFTNLTLDLSATPGWDGELVVMDDGLSIGVVLTPEPAVAGMAALLLAFLRRKQTILQD